MSHSDPSASWQKTDDSERDQADGRDAVLTRSEEQLHVSTVRTPVTNVRFRKRIVTEMRTVTIEVSREELVVQHEPIIDGQAVDRSAPPAPQELDIVLYEQRPVVTLETVPVERIRVRTHTVTDDQSITETVGKEQIELHRDEG